MFDNSDFFVCDRGAQEANVRDHDNLPSLIDLAVTLHISTAQSITELACKHARHGKALLDHLRQPLPTCTMHPELAPLHRHVTMFWQYAAMPMGTFEKIVPDWHDRNKIMIVMAGYGYLPGISFAQEELRAILKRRQNLFVEDPKAGSALFESVDVIRVRLPKELRPFFDDALQNDWHEPIDYVDQLVQAKQLRERCTYPNLMIALEKAVQELGLWLDFEHTEEELAWRRTHHPDNI